jgi:hypothetical protein
MNINQSELADALVLTTSDIKIICCDRCCVRDKMLRWKKKYCTRNATNLELVDKLVLTKSNKFWRGIYKVIHKKIVAVYVALMKKCCKVERVCVGFKRVLGDWLVLGTGLARGESSNLSKRTRKCLPLVKLADKLRSCVACCVESNLLRNMNERMQCLKVICLCRRLRN